MGGAFRPESGTPRESCSGSKFRLTVGGASFFPLQDLRLLPLKGGKGSLEHTLGMLQGVTTCKVGRGYTVGHEDGWGTERKAEDRTREGGIVKTTGTVQEN